VRYFRYLLENGMVVVMLIFPSPERMEFDPEEVEWSINQRGKEWGERRERRKRREGQRNCRKRGVCQGQADVSLIERKLQYASLVPLHEINHLQTA